MAEKTENNVQRRMRATIEPYALCDTITHKVTCTFHEYDGTRHEYVTNRYMMALRLDICTNVQAEPRTEADIRADNLHCQSAKDLREIAQLMEGMAGKHSKYVEKHGRALSAGQRLAHYAIANKVEVIELRLPNGERLDCAPKDAQWRIDRSLKSMA